MVPDYKHAALVRLYLPLKCAEAALTTAIPGAAPTPAPPPSAPPPVRYTAA